MRTAMLIITAGLLTAGTAAWAAEGGGASGANQGKMQGSPNAAGFGKGDTTGSTATGAPGQDVKSDGRMQGPPNAAGFKKDGDAASPGAGGSR
jgi:hypothetical protein